MCQTGNQFLKIACLTHFFRSPSPYLIYPRGKSPPAERFSLLSFIRLALEHRSSPDGFYRSCQPMRDCPSNLPTAYEQT